jgi:hypothetical protein
MIMTYVSAQFVLLHRRDIGKLLVIDLLLPVVN